ncbi:MAG: nucleotide sugar dehydrogenase [Geminicoccaceae bacterium]|nr:nucleotide sugar dehydrogenase [Geminicoccaceae bacterium]
MSSFQGGRYEKSPVLVFDLGGTNARMAIADPREGKLLAVTRRPTCNFLNEPDLDGDALLSGTIDALRDGAEELLDGRRPVAIVCGWPGPTTPQGLVMRSPTILGARHDRPFDARSALSRIWPDCPLVVHNDLTCAGYAYVGRGWEDFCIITVGSGIANKIFVDSRPLLGPGGRGGEAGHVTAWLPGDPAMSNLSPTIHLGDLASGRGTREVMRRYLAVHDPKDTSLSETSTSEDLGKAFLVGDPAAINIIGLVSSSVAHMIASIHGYAGTERFALTGGFATALGDRYRRMIVDRLPDFVWDLGQNWEDMVEIGADADGLEGAAVLAVRELVQMNASISAIGQTGVSASRVRVGIIGLGFVGATTFRYLAAEGCELIGFDIDPGARERANARFTEEIARDRVWQITDRPDDLAKTDILIVAVRIPSPSGDSASLRSVAEMLRKHGRDGQLVIIESTLVPGMTRSFARWMDRDRIEVCHVPERMRVGERDKNLAAVPRLVGGLTANATERSCRFFESVGIRPVPVAAPEISELSKLFENAFLTTNIALVADLTRIAHALGFPAKEVTDAAATKPHGFMSFTPGPGIGGHCLRQDVDLLRTYGEGLDIDLPVFRGVARSARAMPDIVVDRLGRLISRAGGSLQGARVLLIGAGFKIGSDDATETPFLPIARQLTNKGASIGYLDPLIDDLTLNDKALLRLEPADIDSFRPDAIIILSGDPRLSLDQLRSTGALLLDTGGGAIMEGETRAAEKF